jgi:hypothetical protein
MPDISGAVRLAWADAVGASHAVRLAWGQAGDLSSRGSPYTRPAPPSGSTPVVPGNVQARVSIPVQPTYVSTVEIGLVDLRDDAALPLTGASVSLSRGDVMWSASISGPAELAAALRAGEQPPTVALTIGARVWHLLVEDIDQPLAFAQSSCTVRGRSLAALAGPQYQAAQTWIADAPTTAAQVASLAQTYTGLQVRWQMDDWLIPAGAWSATLDPLGVVLQHAGAVQAVVTADRAGLGLTVRPLYEIMPIEWPANAPDVQIPWQFVVSARSEAASTPDYDAVVLAGQQAGDVLTARLAGTSGARQAPLVADPLLVDITAMQQRARAMLGGYGGSATETRVMPLWQGLEVDRGALVRCVDPASTWVGMVRSVAVQAEVDRSSGAVVARQTLGIERRTRFVSGTAAPAAVTAPQPPEFIGWAQQTSGGGNVPIPAHQAGDLIIVWQRRADGWFTTTPPGHTELAYDGNGTYQPRWLLSCIVDADNSMTTYASPHSSTEAWVAVWRNAAPGQVTVSADDLISTTTADCPPVTITSAASVVMCGIGANGPEDLSVPTGLTLVGDHNATSNTYSVWRTPSPVAEFPGATTVWPTYFGGSYFHTWSLELVPA